MVIKRKDGKDYSLRVEEEQPLVQNFFPEETVTIVSPQIIPEEVPIPKKDLLYCLPATIKERIDPLYQEKRSYLVYGKQFTFSGEVKEIDILSLSISTESPIGRGSIIYLPEEKRWWKVTENKDGIVNCMPSDVTPSFG